MLGTLGRYLDGEHAERVRIIESAKGFVVHHHSADGPARVTEISWSDLVTRGSAWAGKPRTLRPWRRQSRPGGSSYEGVFQALGYELDDVHAHSILLDELPDGLLISYQFLNPAEGYMLRKRMAVLGTEQIAAVVQGAGDRWAHPTITFLQRLAE